MKIAINPSQARQVTEDLVAFVHRVSNAKNATPAELNALPGIAKVLLEEVAEARDYPSSRSTP